MGLLDAFDSPQMALAAGLLGGGNFGQALGRGMAGAQAVQLAEQRKREMEAQAEERRAMAEQRQALVQQAQAKQAYEQQFRGSLQGMGGPQGAPGAQGGGMDWQALARQYPDKIDEIKKLAEAQNFGRPTVARTIDGTDANGRPVTFQLDAQGNRIGDGIGQWKAPVSVNQGDRQTFIDPVTLQQRGSFGVNMSQSERDASARGWASNSLANQRFAFDQKGGAEGGKAPSGYRWNADGSALEPIPGGPAAGTKLTESEGKSTLYLSQMREATKAINGVGDNVSPMMVAATGSPFTNWMAGDNSQKAGQAQRQWAEAYLREKTGAAATAGEVENNIKTFFPVVGDSPAVIKQKKLARADAEKAMEIPAGRGNARLEPAMKPKQNGWSIQKVD